MLLSERGVGQIMTQVKLVSIHHNANCQNPRKEIKLRYDWNISS